MQSTTTAILSNTADARKANAQHAACSSQNVGGRFLAAADRHCQHAALVTASQTLSYATIADAARGVARRLAQNPRFVPGNPIALQTGNGPEYLAGFYGVLLAGGVVVPLPERIESSRFDGVLKDSAARIVLTTAQIAARQAVPANVQVALVDFANCSHGGGVPWSIATAAADSPALILYTSGSSGKPKGVLLSHGNLLANTQSILEYLPIRQTDRALALLPFCHAYGNSVLQSHLLSGATLILDGSTTFPNTIVDAMARHRVTSFAAVPEMYYGLIACSALGKRPLPALRYMTVAGGALQHDAVLKMAELIWPAQFFVMYGQTEATARLAYLPSRELTRRPNSIGRAIPNVELQVQDQDGRAATCGEVGELCARGPNVMLGYWNDDAATAIALQDNWLHTGDLGLVDEDGYFYLTGRRNDQVKIRGMQVVPGEIAATLSRRLPACQIVVVPFAMNDATRLALFLWPQQNTQELPREIRRICQETLARHEIPSHIEVVDRFPLTDSLKVDRASLARRAACQMQSRSHAAAENGFATPPIAMETG